ncbi:alkanesulfonate monooxygenase SsuD/methylene tetrahydromethanopterin reductase-like flavin-dependent oxidoreductase (luciferase family) [Nonomuraea fuscirosea]|uniref:Alkanesulfonate monooxygenase SsuD/methylene tetrahydromethanopterin reductase-like flavin-dependent oxidoreductase (Luciferase family) n=1 Tax=Nonomuraea fuscirosea TaxID=1291556 RepID=A0A2T0MMC0_9ACTN|nr:LLM class flavin-dependent oxidoreductase [Nonomuraea fuscirosea]PRX58969.1 alkanesulfonate monooxygenase SsuD/methylene tetrahydromethanopterin reductase-like flavin-dependent oxidoreductase (luciferase family) [Nonomuraea fuscirosea]
MRLGIALDLSSQEPVRPQVDRTVTMLARAEQQGFDSAWVGESYHAAAQPFHLPSVLMVLGHLAGRTSLALGSAVLLLRAYSPEKLAYEAALLDQLCGGKLTLGLGLGSPEVARRAGLPASGPAGAAFDATLKLLREAWSADVNTDAPVAIPPPVRRGGPRVLVGGKVAASARRAATLADGFYGATNYCDDLLIKQSAAYWSYRGGRPGEAGGVVATTRFCVVHEDAATARELAARHFKAATAYYTERGAWMGADGPAELELPMVGTPDEIDATIARYVQAGVTSVQLRVAPFGTPPEVARHTLDLVGRHVLPHWHDTTTSDAITSFDGE